jgi:bleomycin resistance family protein
MATATETTRTAEERSRDHAFVKGVHGVRYQVNDVARSVTFYTTHLGFTLKHQQLPAFASVSLGDADILLSGPGVRISADAEWPATGTWRMEPCCASDQRSSRVRRDLEKSGRAISE